MYSCYYVSKEEAKLMILLNTKSYGISFDILRLFGKGCILDSQRQNTQKIANRKYTNATDVKSIRKATSI